jgi:Na+/proline symporter
MVVILLFLALGALFYLFLMERGVTPTDGAMPLVDGSGEVVVARGDDLFGYVATESGLPIVVGILFLLGLVASTYSAAGSALTALTTSFTLDILGGKSADDRRLGRMRRLTHSLIAVAMTLIIVLFYHFSSGGVITLIFTMASYTYGPLLGMFLFGLLTKRRVKGVALPIIAIASPLICYIVSSNADSWLGGYQFSYEIIVVNAALTMLGMWIARK